MNDTTRSKAKEKTYFKVTFTSEDEVYQVCARKVDNSDVMGLVELSEFIFPEGGLVINPGEERLRKEFEGIKRTWVPYHAILRIDEISDKRAGEVKIVPMRAGKAGGREVPENTPPRPRLHPER
ncbi:MAG: DUF1820 family protein [Deltaproteobacteria bacterium]|nr:DUF1820 family protein [Deltaproteobacteria bacterium]